MTPTAATESVRASAFGSGWRAGLVNGPERRKESCWHIGEHEAWMNGYNAAKRRNRRTR